MIGEKELVCLGARLGHVCSVRKSCQHYQRLREPVGNGMRLFQLPELGEDCRHYAPINAGLSGAAPGYSDEVVP